MAYIDQNERERTRTISVTFKECEIDFMVNATFANTVAGAVTAYVRRKMAEDVANEKAKEA